MKVFLYRKYSSKQLIPISGNVVYNINGFIEKNRDTLFQDFKRLLFSSKNPIYKSMWPEGSHDITKTTKRPLTAGTIFKNSMNELMKLLAMKEPFYVRCIKPNERKSPVTIDTERVIHQIRYFLLICITLYNVILRIARNLLETRKNIKIEPHLF